MGVFPPLLTVTLLLIAVCSAGLLWHSGTVFRHAQQHRRSRAWLARLRRLSELQADQLSEARLIRPLRGAAAWRLLVRRGRRRRQTAAAPRG